MDHPIFSESIRRIRVLMAEQALADPALAAQWAALTPLERDVLERCIHSSGDPAIAADLRFSPADAVGGAAGASVGGAAAVGAAALAAGAPIPTDTAMAAAAVAPMARRTFGNRVACVLDWAPERAPEGSTRTAAGMAAALGELRPGVVLIGSAPTALEVLLAQTAGDGAAPPGQRPGQHWGPRPALVIGMPVGFVGVAESKRHLAESGLAHVRLEGSKGGAGLVAAACNALLRAAWLQAASAPSP